jgi:hypothetical protein
VLEPNPPVPKPFRFAEGVNGSEPNRPGVEREVRFAIMIRGFLIAVERGMVVSLGQGVKGVRGERRAIHLLLE